MSNQTKGTKASNFDGHQFGFIQQQQQQQNQLIEQQNNLLTYSISQAQIEAQSNNQFKNQEKKCCVFCKRTAFGSQMLIYPCLCGYMAHRFCLKKYMIINFQEACQKCLAHYQVQKSNIALTHVMTGYQFYTLVVKLTFQAVIIIISYYLPHYIRTDYDDDNDQQLTSSRYIYSTWESVILYLSYITIGLNLLYLIIMLLKFWKNIQIKDINILCQVNEIHLQNKTQNSKIFKEFVLEIYSKLIYIQDLQLLQKSLMQPFLNPRWYFVKTRKQMQNKNKQNSNNQSDFDSKLDSDTNGSFLEHGEEDNKFLSESQQFNKKNYVEEYDYLQDQTFEQFIETLFTNNNQFNKDFYKNKKSNVQYSDFIKKIQDENNHINQDQQLNNQNQDKNTNNYNNTLNFTNQNTGQRKNTNQNFFGAQFRTSCIKNYKNQQVDQIQEEPNNILRMEKNLIDQVNDKNLDNYESKQQISQFMKNHKLQNEFN
ncbi:hypothetical protein PPERSA_12360 [Pseudocohnilembus persalinus]|uniref:Uncharacterized protein n=1 Tax=Pseudocohnilembus persalinus TaxID=266149 RepID=A0A0V0R8C9_PSEPJ|nr:hypothetical protein PPERSA_12360 [Pseudocohnilembus persalinus]|eukprot:KRX10739.1 hypothetical protein PPERSA_12360 [Pseudocohnilembus persalinus]